MDTEEDVPKEELEVTKKIYTQAFTDQCEKRGYTHLEDEEKIAQAIKVVEKLRERLSKEGSNLSKEAFQRISEEDG